MSDERKLPNKPVFWFKVKSKTYTDFPDEPDSTDSIHRHSLIRQPANVDSVFLFLNVKAKPCGFLRLGG